MVLQKPILSSTGIEVKGAYIKVDEYSCSKDNIINARARAYVNQSAAENGNAPIEVSDIQVNLDGDCRVGSYNMKTQIYNEIKCMEDYSDAMDIFE